MAILIKNADVPKCCKECRFKYAVKCRTYTGFHHQDTERAAKCPLVEVWDDCQKCIEALPSAQSERSSEIQDILEYLDKVLHPVISPDHWNVYSELHDMISMLPSAQPEIIRCKECMNHGNEICYFWSHFYGIIDTPDDGFCHKAERRTDESD